MRLIATKVNAGVTMLEIMIVLTISTIVLSFFVPIFGNWIVRMEMRSIAEAFRSALQKARIEAISRNTQVRFEINQKDKSLYWSVNCKKIKPNCKGELAGQNGLMKANFTVKTAVENGKNSLSDLISNEKILPAGVTFNSLGAAPAIAANDDISRIDIAENKEKNPVRLTVLISASGLIRLCNPGVMQPHPEAC